MNYQARFLEGTTVEELKLELKQMYDDQYRYGHSIDRPRMWDINYTIKLLELSQ